MRPNGSGTGACGAWYKEPCGGQGQRHYFITVLSIVGRQVLSARRGPPVSVSSPGGGRRALTWAETSCRGYLTSKCK